MSKTSSKEDRLLHISFDKAPLPGLMIDVQDQTILKANKAAKEFYGLNLIKKNINCIHYDTKNEFTSLKQKISVIQTKHIARNKKIRDVECYINLIQLEAKKIFYVLVRDITDELIKHEKLVNEASIDELTKIPNRRFFITILQSYLENLKRYQEKFSVIYFDIDNFKYYNDHYGHKFGDQILKKIVGYISKEKRASDFFARLSGDEFVLIFNKVSNTHDLDLICKNLNQAVKDGSKKISPPITISIGAYMVEKFESYEKILARSDRAMYKAKKQGGNCFYMTTHNSR